MSKLNQIQSELKAIDQAKFQRLCDLYLYKRGYECINSIGLVIGADKVRKGTPDSLVALPNGKFVFVESTTQQERIYEKFRDDLSKCFDEKKTGIPTTKIQEIVLCHNGILSPSELNSLAEECQGQGCNLNVFGISQISNDLYQKYPGLALDFLGLEIDTGQIVEPEEFISAYNKSSFATPLDTNFHFRGREVGEVIRTLEQDDLVIISGRAGVGKSRLALECCARLAETRPEYKVFCIRNRGADLFNDLQVYFKPPGSYIIFVDDANRVSGFEYVLHFLHEQTEDRKIKIIVTVRDYALEKVQEKTRSYGCPVEIEITPLSDKEIKELATAEFNIHHPYVLDRISEIAMGNPRLAIMAARVTAAENTLQSINDVSALYDEYFGPIWKELNNLEDSDLLRVAGIVTFFRVVDRTSEQLMEAITETFGISPQTFWEKVCQLHEMEVLDQYENEVVRVSDQVLSTYLFYLAFFKERALSVSALLEHLFPAHKHRLIDALNPVVNAFDSKKVAENLLPYVNSAWTRFQKVGDEDSLIELMKTFWFLKQTDVLCYVQDQINSLEAEHADLTTLNFTPDRNASEDQLLKLIRLFRYTEEQQFKIALELLFAYLVKRPGKLPQVLRLLTEDFGFDHESYLVEFRTERCVIDELWRQTEDGRQLLFSKAFLVVAERFLHTHHHTTEAKGNHTIKVINFHLPPTPQVLDLRRTIWQRVFALYRIQELQAEVLKLLQSHRSFEYHSCDKQIVEQDAAEILPFIELELNRNSYAHCALVQDYLDALRRKKVLFDASFQENFRSEAYRLAEVLFDDWAERSELGWKQYQEQKRAQIKEHFRTYTREAYEHFFRSCFEIQGSQERGHEAYQFHGRIIEILLNLASDSPDLFVEVFEAYLNQGDTLNLADHYPSGNLVAKLIEIYGDANTYQILVQPEFGLRKKWLSFFFVSLPSEKVAAQHTLQLYSLYQSGELGELPQGLDFLSHYQATDENVFLKVTTILAEKAEQDIRYSFYLADLFHGHTETNAKVKKLFAYNVNLLKRAYFHSLRHDRFPDYEGTGFNAILDLDENFACEYIAWMYDNSNKHKQLTLSHFDDERNYDFLWLRSDWMKVMESIVWKIFESEQERFSLGGSYAETFFIRRADEQTSSDIRDRQEHFIGEQIRLHSNNSDFMKLIFGVVANFSYDHRLFFLRVFIEHNKRFEDFVELPLDPGSFGWSGSAVPVLQKKAEYFESLLKLFNSTAFLKHKQQVEQRIQGLRKWIEDEKKRDFMEN